jgi:F0F1-type ATP synthase membrane subunit b/b'
MNIRDLTNEEKLDTIYEMTKENNKILRSMHREHYVSLVFRIIYWLVVLGFIGGSYYYMKPYISMLTGNASKIEETMTQLNQLKESLPEAKALNQMMEGMKKPGQ